VPAHTDADLKTTVLRKLQLHAASDLEDYFSFIGKADMSLEAARKGGSRFPVAANLAGRLFVKFHIDVGVGDAKIEPAGFLNGKDWLQFADIAPAKTVDRFVCALSRLIEQTRK